MGLHLVALYANSSETPIGTERYRYKYWRDWGHTAQEVMWVSLPNYERYLKTNKTMLGLPNCLFRRLPTLVLDEMVRVRCKHNTEELMESLGGIKLSFLNRLDISIEQFA